MPLPLILIGAGIASAVGGAIAARRQQEGVKPKPQAPQRPSQPIATGSGTEGAATPSALRNTARWAPLVDQLRGDVPAWLLLGHTLVESAGNPNEVPKDKTGKVILLPGRTEPEKGLLQIDQATSKELGRDHAKMFDPAYNIATGVLMYRSYAKKLLSTTTFASSNDLWRTAYLVFGIGFAGTKPFLPTAPITWANVAQRIILQCGTNCTKCKPSRCRALRANERVWAVGRTLEMQTHALV